MSCRYADAVLSFSDRVVALDHRDGSAYVLTLHHASASAEAAARSWLATARRSLEECAAQAAGQWHAGALVGAPWPPSHHSALHVTHPYKAAHPKDGRNVCAAALSTCSAVLDCDVQQSAAAAEVHSQAAPGNAEDACTQSAAHRGSRRLASSFALARDKAQYMRDVAVCQDALHRGDSYEICLTNVMTAAAPAFDAWGFYGLLRDINAAPHAAWLHCGQVCPRVLGVFSNKDAWHDEQ